MKVTKAGGGIGIPGLYVTEDPGAHEKAAKVGALSIRIGLGWAKSISFHTGQCPVRACVCVCMNHMSLTSLLTQHTHTHTLARR